MCEINGVLLKALFFIEIILKSLLVCHGSVAFWLYSYVLVIQLHIFIHVVCDSLTGF